MTPKGSMPFAIVLDNGIWMGVFLWAIIKWDRVMLRVGGLDLLLVGVVGFGLSLGLNIVGVFLLEQSAARPFQVDWWSVWFPNYVVWSILIVVGAAISGSNSTR